MVKGPVQPGKARGKALVFRLAVLILLGLAAVTCVLWLVNPQPPRDGHWLAGALMGRLFLGAATVLLVSTALVLLCCRAMWQMGASLRKQRTAHGEGGAAIVEFALVLPIVLMLVLIMVQSTLLMAGNLCISYAAFCAARSAIVTVPLNLQGEPSNYVLDQSVKLNRIKAAAVWAVMPISCGNKAYPTGDFGVMGQGLSGFFGGYGKATPTWALGSLPQRLQYALDNTVVTLSPPAHLPKYRPYARDDWQIIPNLKTTAEDFVAEDLVVTVEHTLYLSVPYASRLFYSFGGVDARELDFGAGQYGVVVRSSCRLPNEGQQDWVDVEEFEDPNVSQGP